LSLRPLSGWLRLVPIVSGAIEPKPVIGRIEIRSANGALDESRMIWFHAACLLDSINTRPIQALSDTEYRT
jgi:hypothetical protein